MEAKEEETICSKKLTASNSTGNVNTEKHPLDISVEWLQWSGGTEARCGRSRRDGLRGDGI